MMRKTFIALMFATTLVLAIRAAGDPRSLISMIVSTVRAMPASCSGSRTP